MPWLDPSDVEVIESVDSTQDDIKRRLASGRPVPACLLALDQTRGRGRFGREWNSAPGDSLTMSVVLDVLPQPWMSGFALALAAAGTFHCRLQWPNDLTIRRKKVGGILTEMVDSPLGPRTVVGLGVNLNQAAFPSELETRATSLCLERGSKIDPAAAARAVLERLAGMVVPSTWSELAPIWMLFDETPGKHYRLPTGENAVALGLGPEGELICSVEGETRTVMAAEALFGRQ